MKEETKSKFDSLMKSYEKKQEELKKAQDEKKKRKIILLMIFSVFGKI